MTLPPVIRIFFAIDLSQAVKERLNAYIGMLRKKSKAYGIRWTKPENLHITLQFLPEVKSADIPAMVKAVRMQMENVTNSMPIQLGGIKLFPDPYRPRVIVLAVSPQAELATLSSLIGQGITASGYSIENRPYRAHLTLGRIKQPQGMNLNFLNEDPVPDFESILLNDVALFRSEPQHDGSKYTLIDQIPLIGTL